LRIVGLRIILIGVTLLLGGQPYKVLAESHIESLRFELSLLSSQIEDLRSSLLKPEVRSLAPNDAGIALLRLNALEAKLRATVGRVEALEYNLRILKKDATHRIREFNLRLSEMEVKGGQVLSELEEESYGNDNSENPASDVSNETLTFDKALLSFNGEDYNSSIEQFEAFRQSYPLSINIAEVTYWLGRAKFAIKDLNGAANEYLDAFSLAPFGEFAPKALLGLSSALGSLGQIDQACLTIDELKSRFPIKVDQNLSEIISVEKQLKCSN
jgi:TolA-binding protein